MAEEAEKKTGFVLNKKKPEAPVGKPPAPKSGTGEKKKVVVVRKKNPAPENKSPQNGSAGHAPAAAVRPVAKHPVSKAPASAPASSDHTQTQNRPRSNAPFELNSARPNVKAGNLSGNPRQGGGYGGRGGYGGNGFNRGAGGPRREGGFTGAQARENYQNRGSGGFKRGYSRTS